MTASNILKFVVEHNIDIRNCLKKIEIGSLKPNPKRPKNRLSESAKSDLRASIIKLGFLNDEFLVGIPDKRNENKFIIIDGNERAEIVRKHRPDISYLPCLVLPVNLAEASELLIPADWQCTSSKKHSFLEILTTEIDKSMEISGNTKISGEMKKSIALRAGFSADNPESINRALFPLRAIYRDLCEENPENTKLKFSEVIEQAVKSGEPAELVNFAANGKPHPFKQAYIRRTSGKGSNAPQAKDENIKVDETLQIPDFLPDAGDCKIVEVREYKPQTAQHQNSPAPQNSIFADLYDELNSTVESIENKPENSINGGI